MKKRVAIVYDRVNKWGGAERVLLALHDLFPEAPLYTSVYDDKNADWAKVFPKIKTSFLQNFPFAKGNHEFFAPLMALAFESFDFSGYDLVISVTSEYAKAIKTGPGTKHICYCLTPTRYLWSGFDVYFSSKSVLSLLGRFWVSYLRKLDSIFAQRPDKMVAISSEVQKRIAKYYGRESEIIYPPVEFPRSKKTKGKGRHFLIVSRLVPYKRIDMAVRLFNKLAKKLVVVGTGRDFGKIKSIANKNIVFKGSVSERVLAKIYHNAIALVMPQEEDFGITAIEAALMGVPVIAYNKGGAKDTVVHGKTGVLFEQQTENSLEKAIKIFEKSKFDRSYMSKHSQKFSKEKFIKAFKRLVV